MKNNQQEMDDVIDEILKEMERSEHEILFNEPIVSHNKKNDSNRLDPLDLDRSVQNEQDNFDSISSTNEICGSSGIKSDYEYISENDSDSDEDLMDFISQMKTKVIVIGVGGAGNNILSRLYDSGAPFVETLAINTDAQDLFSTNSTKKLLIGKKITYGFGTGNDPEKGKLAAEQDKDRIIPFVKKDIVILLCGLGGGTGSGAAPIIAEYAKENSTILISICTLPFNAEGKQKELIAYKSLHQLAQYSDALISMPNNSITSIFPNIGMLEGFKIMDELIGKNLKAVTDLVSRCGMINLDLADIKNTFNIENLNSKDLLQTGFVSVGEIPLSSEYSDSQFSINSLSKFSKDKIRQEVLKILRNPINKVDPKKIDRCIISISGSPKMRLLEINEIVDTITQNIEDNAVVKFGTIIDPNLDCIRIAILARGPKSDYIKKSEELFGPIVRCVCLKREFVLRNVPESIPMKTRLNPSQSDFHSKNIEISIPKIEIDQNKEISDRALKTHFRLRASQILSSRSQERTEKSPNNYFSGILKRKFEIPNQNNDDSPTTIKKVVDFVL